MAAGKSIEPVPGKELLIRQMEAARVIMQENRELLRKLAKGLPRRRHGDQG